MDAQSRGKMCCPWNSASVLIALFRGRGGADRTAVSIAQRGNESSATGPPAPPPPPSLVLLPLSPPPLLSLVVSVKFWDFGVALARGAFCLHFVGPRGTSGRLLDTNQPLCAAACASAQPYPQPSTPRGGGGGQPPPFAHFSFPPKSYCN